ncbi:putative Sodium:sulfate symporter [Escherichia coli]|uniref:Putative Sodium:sulfate symporter n=1 Tax=Escherichia coli TaxID=562 RepID=A0A376YB16_ECOLX|nr:putative Sodium:sulfate symporter [Escherichia coli]
MNKEIVMEANSDISDPMYYWFYASSQIKRTGVGAFGIYLAAIVGLVIKPFPEPVVLLLPLLPQWWWSVTYPTVRLNHRRIKRLLFRYTWLVFPAFTLSAAFVTPV